MKNFKTYPSIGGSWLIVAIIIGCMLIAAPTYLLKTVLGESSVTLIYYTAAFGLALLFILHKRKKEMPYSSFDFKLPSLQILILAIAAMLFLIVGISVPISSSLPMPEPIREMFENLAKSAKTAPGVITLVLAAPILEEMIFRGVMLDGLLRRYSPTKSILLSAFLFALVHMNPWQFIPAMVIGLLAGWCYYRTRNLLLPIIIHFTNNSLAVCSTYLGETEKTGTGSFLELYGGVQNAVICITTAIILAAVSIYLLKKAFSHEKQQFPLIDSENSGNFEEIVPGK